MLSTIFFAFLIDLSLGDPPNRWHPVAWMGSLIAELRKNAPTNGQAIPFMAGAAITLGGAGLVFGIGTLVDQLGRRLLPWPLRAMLEGAILKSTFSLGGLVRAGREVEAALAVGDLTEARRVVSWHLVSRDTSQLNESQVSAATIESLAENLSDGVIGPILYYALGGLPAALAYRYLNTCDSMLGYRDAEREWLGKFPARFDDLINLLPARQTALGLLAVGALRAENRQQGLAIYQRDNMTTASPNAGHPMSAMAGVLEVELEKVDHYRLGAGLPSPQAADISRAIDLLYWSTALTVGVVWLLGFVVQQLRKGKSTA